MSRSTLHTNSNSHGANEDLDSLMAQAAAAVRGARAGAHMNDSDPSADKNALLANRTPTRQHLRTSSSISSQRSGDTLGLYPSTQHDQTKNISTRHLNTGEVGPSMHRHRRTQSSIVSSNTASNRIATKVLTNTPRARGSFNFGAPASAAKKHDPKVEHAQSIGDNPPLSPSNSLDTQAVAPPSPAVKQAQQQGIFDEDLAYVAPRNYMFTSPDEEQAAQQALLHNDASNLRVNALLKQVANEQRRANAAYAAAHKSKERLNEAEEEIRLLRERLRDERGHSESHIILIEQLQSGLEAAAEEVKRVEAQANERILLIMQSKQENNSGSEDQFKKEEVEMEKRKHELIKIEKELQMEKERMEGEHARMKDDFAKLKEQQDTVCEKQMKIDAEYMHLKEEKLQLEKGQLQLQEQQAILKEKETQLKQDNKDLIDKKKSISQNNDMRDMQFNETVDALKEARDLLESSSERVAQLESQVDEAHKCADDALEELKRISSELDSTKLENSKLEDDLKNCSRNIEKLERERICENEETVRILAKMTLTTKELEKLRKDQLDSQSEIQRLLQEKQKENEALQKFRNDLSREVTQKEILSSKLKDLETQQKAYMQLIESKDEELNLSLTASQEIERKRKEAFLEMESLKQRVRDYSDQISTLKHSLLAKQSEVEKAQVELSSIPTINEQLKNAQLKRVETERTVDELRVRVQHRELEIAALVQKHSAEEGKAKLLAEQLEKMKIEVARDNELYQEKLAKAISESENKMYAKIWAKIEHDQREALNAARMDERAACQSQLERERQHGAELAKQITSLQQLRSEKEQEMWEARLAELRTHHSELIEQLEEYAAERAESADKAYKEQYAKLTKENEILKKELESLQKEASFEKERRVEIEEAFEARVHERVKELEEHLKSSSDRVNAAEAAARQAQENASALIQSVEQLQQHHEEEKMQHAQSVRELHVQFELELQVHHEKLTSQVKETNKYQYELEEAKIDSAKARIELSSINEMLDKLRQDYSELEIELETEQKRLKESDVREELFQKQVAELSERLRYTKEQLENEVKLNEKISYEASVASQELQQRNSDIIQHLETKEELLKSLVLQLDIAKDELSSERSSFMEKEERYLTDIEALTAQRDLLLQEVSTARALLSEKSMLLSLAAQAHAIVSDAVHKFAEIAQDRKVGAQCLLELSEKVERASAALSAPIQHAGHTLMQSRSALALALQKAQKELVDCSELSHGLRQPSLSLDELSIPECIAPISVSANTEVQEEGDSHLTNLKGISKEVLSECAGRMLLHSLNIDQLQDQTVGESDNSIEDTTVEKLSMIDQIKLIFGELETLVEGMSISLQRDDGEGETVSKRLVHQSTAGSSVLQSATPEAIEAARRAAVTAADEVISSLVSAQSGAPLLLLATKFIVLESRTSLMLCTSKAALQCRASSLKVYLSRVRASMTESIRSSHKKRSEYYKVEASKLTSLLESVESDLERLEEAQKRVELLKRQVSSSISGEGNCISSILEQGESNAVSEQTDLEQRATLALQQLESETNTTLSEVLDLVQQFDRQQQLRSETFGDDIMCVNSNLSNCNSEPALSRSDSVSRMIRSVPSSSDLSGTRLLKESPSAGQLNEVLGSIPTVSTMKELRWRLSNMQIMLSSERKLHGTLCLKVEAFEKQMTELASKVQKTLGQVSALGMSSSAIGTRRPTVAATITLANASILKSAADVTSNYKKKANILDIRLVSLDSIAIKVQKAQIDEAFKAEEECELSKLTSAVADSEIKVSTPESDLRVTDDLVSENNSELASDVESDSINHASDFKSEYDSFEKDSVAFHGVSVAVEEREEEQNVVINDLFQDHTSANEGVNEQRTDVKVSESRLDHEIEEGSVHETNIPNAPFNADYAVLVDESGKSRSSSPSPSLSEEGEEENWLMTNVTSHDPPEFIGLPVPSECESPCIEDTQVNEDNIALENASHMISPHKASSNMSAEEGGSVRQEKYGKSTSPVKPSFTRLPAPSHILSLTRNSSLKTSQRQNVMPNEKRYPRNTPRTTEVAPPSMLLHAHTTSLTTAILGRSKPSTAFTPRSPRRDQTKETDNQRAIGFPNRSITPATSATVSTKKPLKTEHEKRQFAASAAASIRDEIERKNIIAQRLQAQKNEEEAQRAARVQQLMHREQGFIAVRGPDGKMIVAKASEYPVPFQGAPVAQNTLHTNEQSAPTAQSRRPSLVAEIGQKVSPAKHIPIESEKRLDQARLSADSVPEPITNVPQERHLLSKAWKPDAPKAPPESILEALARLKSLNSDLK